MKNQEFQLLSDDDVVSLHHSKQALFEKTNFRVQDCYLAFDNHFGIDTRPRQNGGITASFLKANDSALGWIEGQMNVCLAFLPEQVITASETAKTSYQPLDKDLLKTQHNVGKLWCPGCELIYELKDRLRINLGIQDAAYSKYFWLDRGIECEVLQTTGRTSGWQSGLVRLQIIFVPKDEIADPEESASENSALESLRQPVLTTL
ncbi:MAG: hypothetical protein DCF25_02500 [Leptolyngbya foveolarum]|uniref:Uncharacterized protein n=1 Tax=Leptolyngbya foveolarum TaxID=47253 RepID=A0A2W4URB9_9CYAN|nr:MAG: hypothetical protein DCF25_02500 [Leptolyngbya foveolarum]